MSFKEDIKRIADALEKMAEPVELQEMPEDPEPVCPHCQARDPVVLITASAAASVKLSAALALTVEVVCSKCGKAFSLRPGIMEILS